MPFTAVGDVIECKIVKVKSNCAYGIIERIITPSPNRIEPTCNVFKKCGGCSYCHIDYKGELQIKQQNIVDSFKRIGNIDAEFLPIIGAKDIEKYRNKAQYPIAQLGDKIVCGYFAKRSHRIVENISCNLSPDIFEQILKFTLNYCQINNIKGYDEQTGKGLLRHIYIRQGYHSKQIMVCLVVTSINRMKKAKDFQNFVNLLVEKFNDIKSVILNENSQNTNVILGDRISVVYGKSYITDIMCGVKFQIDSRAFYQVNTQMAEILYEQAMQFADLNGDEILLDLYCGCGTIGLSMANKVKKLIGVEIVPQSIESAKENAKIAGINNAEFICSDAGQAVKKLASENLKPDVVIVDPPRKGCDQTTVESIVKMLPQRIVMISCNHTTAARDCKLFGELGYKTQKIVGVDLFPRTSHVECVVLMSRK